jgi:hypothetical protein
MRGDVGRERKLMGRENKIVRDNEVEGNIELGVVMKVFLRISDPLGIMGTLHQIYKVLGKDLFFFG